MIKVADEVEYKNLPEDAIDKAVRYIKDSNKLMEMLDSIVFGAIDAVT